MPELKINVSEAWDGDNPIKVPKFHPDCIPTEQDIIDVFKYFEQNEGILLDSLLTFTDADLFLKEGKEHASIQGST